MQGRPSTQLLSRPDLGGDAEDGERGRFFSRPADASRVLPRHPVRAHAEGEASGATACFDKRSFLERIPELLRTA